MSSNLGLKIVGEQLEVGFTADNREQFDSYVDRLRMIADTVWSKEPVEKTPEEAPQSELRPPGYQGIVMT